MRKYLPIILLMILFFILNPIALINIINNTNDINETNETNQINEINDTNDTNPINPPNWYAYAQDIKKQSSTQMPPVSQDYIIGKGDVLSVFVWRNEQLSSEVVVRPDGMISLPLLQDLKAEGLTVLQLKEEITRRFSEDLTNPRVTVMVNEINSYKVSVMGNVATPGVFPITGDTTLVEAISMAGGFTQWANKKKITVITHQGEEKKKITVNYKKIASGKDPSQNIILKRGDTIIVP
ncbi:MAG: polysaccharide biosynthesis/export family protein [Candidatus Hodarchaeota archaeon]